MELFTLKYNEGALGTATPSFERQDVIDEFESLIWTEKYYGDSEVQVVLPITMDLIEKLPPGIFLGIDKSDEIMSLETVNIEDGKLKLEGISLLSWLNNRFVRTSDVHKDQTWSIEGQVPGLMLWSIISGMTGKYSPYLTDIFPTDIPLEHKERLQIPELGLHSYDESGSPITVAVPFGPLYDVVREIATTYQIGIQIVLEKFPKTIPEDTRFIFSLGFRSYRGLNRTSTQDPDDPQQQIVRFSPSLDSLLNVKELHSLGIYKNLAFAFGSDVDDSLGRAGMALVAGTDEKTSFNLRAIAVPINISPDMPDAEILVFLDSQAKTTLDQNPYIRAVDGEIVSTHMFQYGRDYNLGDLVEIQGVSDTTQIVRVMEYIRTQDATGERAYPTVESLGPVPSQPEFPPPP